MGINRRDFFTGHWLSEALTKSTLGITEQETIPTKEENNYFSSIETCYAFLSEVPMEDLLNEARKRGLPSDGLSKFELAKSLFSDGQYQAQQKC